MKLDGAGSAKLATLEEAQVSAQRIHGLVERMALAVRTQNDITPLIAQLRRAAPPLATMLKGQFGMIADQVTSLLLMATRPGGAQVKVRSLREGVASLRTQLDIAVTRVIEKHSLPEAERDKSGSLD
jgi:hypothetical protein